MKRSQFLKILTSSILATSHYKLIGQSNTIRKEIIIIGGGISGLAAARKLMSNGFQVTILEARNRIGGRIWTDKSLGYSVEMGVSIVHGFEGNPISNLIDNFKFPTQKINLEDSEYHDGRGNILTTSELAKLDKVYSIFLERLKTRDKASSKRILIDSIKKSIISEMSLSKLEESYLIWMIGFDFEGKNGTNLENISLQSLQESKNPFKSSSILTNGFSEIPRLLSKGINIKTSHIVSKIEYGNKIKIHTNHGEFTSDYAIVTVPLGVLKKRRIQFIPELPINKLQSIENLGFGITNKVFLKFPKRFWTSNIHKFGNIAHSDKERIDFWDLNPVKDTPILAGFMYGDKAISIETKNRKDSIKECVNSLRKIFGNKIPNPLEESHSKWNLDPFSHGTNSYMSINSKKEDYTNLEEPINNKLFFAGEATNSIYPATVHGAYLSGEREADRIISIEET